jgi:hypothetical protein
MPGWGEGAPQLFGWKGAHHADSNEALLLLRACRDWGPHLRPEPLASPLLFPLVKTRRGGSSHPSPSFSLAISLGGVNHKARRGGKGAGGGGDGPGRSF